MAKAVISNRIFLDVTLEQSLEIRKTLTYRIPVFRSSKPGSHRQQQEYDIIRNYRNIKEGIISIPQGRIDLIPEGHEIVDRRVLVPAEFPEALIPMRNNQVEVYENLNDSGFINAMVGWGKTFSALHICKKLGQKALVVTPTTVLRDQWVDEVVKLFGIEPGVVGYKLFDLDSSIVIGNIQSLVKHKEELGDKFGTIILDECHRVPANTFTDFIDRSKARFRIGLSGTLKRKDGKHVMFPDYFGNNFLKPKLVDETLEPTVRIVKTDNKLVGSNWAQKINNLMYDKDYQAFISVMTKLYIDRGYVPLVIAERVDFLKEVKNNLGDEVALVIGETADRKKVFKQVESGEIKGIVASRSIFAEGSNVPPLSMVILTCPINNEVLLEQVIGRIQRKFEGKKNPIVIDIHFKGRTANVQNSNRLSFYASKGWKVEGL